MPLVVLTIVVMAGVATVSGWRARHRQGSDWDGRSNDVMPPQGPGGL